MAPVDRTETEAFVRDCHRVADMGLVRCSSGNMSRRIGGDRMLVTGTRTWMADIEPEQVSVVRVSDGDVLNGVRPSIESRFHAGILRARPEMGAVLHFQSPCATVLTCTGTRDVDFNVIVEVPYYIGPVAEVPFLMPGSEELHERVVGAMATHDMLLMRAHGQVTLGLDPRDATQRAAFFELACEIILRGGDRLDHISPEHARALRDSGRASKPGA